VATQLTTLDVRTRGQWRAWLGKHHATSPGVWLVRYKQHAGVESMAYEDLVREALCFGWIDSLIKRLDDDRYAIKVTPRRATSKWSEINRKRWAELKDAGLLHEAGTAAAPGDHSYAPKPKIPELPAYIATAFKQHAKAWTAFRALARGHRRQYVAWIHTAKRQETRERRISEAIRMLTAGRKLGLK